MTDPSSDPSDVLAFWLGERGDVAPGPETLARWFGVDPALDETIRTRFGRRVDEALEGGLRAWEDEASARVALILLLDQFPRNLFRGQARAFAGDPRAMALVRETPLAMLRTLHPVERYFVLVPWMHAEGLDEQREGEAAFRIASQEAPSAFRPLFENGLDYARRHRRVIERFGRFPHRNADLGRVSTPEEMAFLADFGAGF